MSVVKTLEFENEQEYELFMSALTQAGAAYGQIARAAYFGLEIPLFIEEFYNKQGITNPSAMGECMQERLFKLKDVVAQLDKQSN